MGIKGILKIAVFVVEYGKDQWKIQEIIETTAIIKPSAVVTKRKKGLGH